MNVLKMAELDLANKKVIVREDLNVPFQNGQISDFTRIEKCIPTLKKALQAQARVLVLSHLGRPKEGQFDPQASLAPVAKALSDQLGQPVPLLTDWLNGAEIGPGQIALAENVRFLVGEESNQPELAEKMAQQCDIFVMDAFATAHRAQASTVGIAQHAPIACAGLLLMAELEALSKALERPKKPLVAVIGGSKVSTKIHLLKNLLEKVDGLIVGGGIANTFLAAEGYPVGKSLYEPTWIWQAKELINQARKLQIDFPLPHDVVVAAEMSPNAKAITKSVDAIESTDVILDVGPVTSKVYAEYIVDAGTIVWNGPLGVFEYPQFSHGTQALAKAIASSHAFSIAGGGDTLSALSQFGLSDKISYISTGGGAFLEFLEGATLPAVAMLIKRAASL
ncbi:MAG: phosphoglycerate kinase [Proteobacteria bacterium]|nr:phosphoglycerate kinase [Pseudomonadota bacterium]